MVPSDHQANGTKTSRVIPWIASHSSDCRMYSNLHFLRFILLHCLSSLSPLHCDKTPFQSTLGSTLTENPTWVYLTTLMVWDHSLISKFCCKRFFHSRSWAESKDEINLSTHTLHGINRFPTIEYLRGVDHLFLALELLILLLVGWILQY